MGDCPVNHLQELLFCHGIIVEHFVRDVYNLDEVLFFITLWLRHCIIVEAATDLNWLFIQTLFLFIT